MACQVGRAPGRLHHVGQVLARRTQEVQFIKRQRAFGQDAGQQVIEVMSNAAGQHAQALQLLGLQHGVFNLFAGNKRGDVVGGAGNPVHELVFNRLFGRRGQAKRANDFLIAPHGHTDVGAYL